MGKNCQTVVTGHEVGHMFGAAHNEEVSNWIPKEGFEYGSLIEGGYVSIMGYSDSWHRKRISYFSSPEVRI